MGKQVNKINVLTVDNFTSNIGKKFLHYSIEFILNDSTTERAVFSFPLEMNYSLLKTGGYLKFFEENLTISDEENFKEEDFLSITRQQMLDFYTKIKFEIIFMYGKRFKLFKKAIENLFVD